MIIRCLFISLSLVVMLFGVNLKSFLTYTFDTTKQYDIEKAKSLYFKNKCNVCHGDNGEKGVSGTRVLKDMSPEEIKGALIGYTLDSGASATASQMAFYARKLTHDDMDNIIAYIKGGNFAVDLQVKELLEKEPEKKTKHNIFLK